MKNEDPKSNTVEALKDFAMTFEVSGF
jgi:hypothetical protein